MRANALILAIALTAAGSAIGQQPNFGPRRDGTDFFRAILKESRTTPLSGTDALRDNPKNKVLIVFGDTSIVDTLIANGGLQDFLRGGGSVLIATDQATSDSFKSTTGVRVDGQFITADPANSYRNEFTDCPLVVDQFGRGPRHPIFAPLPVPSKVATNRPSYISHSAVVVSDLGILLPIAWLPRHGSYEIARQRFDTRLVFAVANSSPTNHLLVIADHSIFINDMMWQGDNDNIGFAFGVVRWLTDNGRRTEVLFIDNGAVQDDFNVSLDFPPPQPPPLEAFVPLANETLVALERDNVFNEMLLQMTGGPFPIFRGVAIFITLCLLLAGLYRFLNARQRPESRTIGPPDEAGAGTAISASERRHQAVIAQGNLAEAARELAHLAFASVGLTPAAEVPPPVVTVPGSWFPFSAWRWGRKVRGFWSLAVKGTDRRVSPASLQTLDENLRRLLAAVSSDKVRLAAADSAI